MSTSHDSPSATEVATFAAGCFWGVEAEFRRVPGVIDATVGYEGGHTENPTYRDVCRNDTGHAEVVRVVFDPARVTFRTLAELFFTLHDPTQMNRQGPDVGTQYRSAIFVHSPEQQRVAEEVKAEVGASGRFKRPVVTVISPSETFYRAEDYHQQYFTKNGIAVH